MYDTGGSVRCFMKMQQEPEEIAADRVKEADYNEEIITDT